MRRLFLQRWKCDVETQMFFFFLANRCMVMILMLYGLHLLYRFLKESNQLARNDITYRF